MAERAEGEGLSGPRLGAEDAGGESLVPWVEGEVEEAAGLLNEVPAGWGKGGGVEAGGSAVASHDMSFVTHFAGGGGGFVLFGELFQHALKEAYIAFKLTGLVVCVFS